MSNIAPVLRLRGMVHSAALRTVPAYEASPAQRDADTGRMVRAAREATEEYDVVDLLVLTEDGGFAKVLLHGESLAQLWHGQVPEKSASVDLPVRPYVEKRFGGNGWFSQVGFSVARDLAKSDDIRMPKRLAQPA